MRLAVICSALLLVVGLAAWAIELRPRGDAPTAPAPVSRTDEVEIARLRQEVRSMQREAAELRRVVRQGDASGGEDARPAGMASEEPPAQERGETSFESYCSSLDRHFSTEPVDASWRAQEELGRRLARSMPSASSVRSLECRRTMCRLETKHRDDEGYKEFARLFAMHPDVLPIWTGPAVFRIVHTPERPGDDLLAVAFLARESFPPFGSRPDTPPPTKDTGP